MNRLAAVPVRPSALRFLLVVVIGPAAAALLGLRPADGGEPGLTQGRFATAEQVVAPTGISVSPRGVVFVSCDVNGLTDEQRTERSRRLHPSYSWPHFSSSLTMTLGLKPLGSTPRNACRASA